MFDVPRRRWAGHRQRTLARGSRRGVGGLPAQDGKDAAGEQRAGLVGNCLFRIEALVEDVGTFGDGPEIPEVDLENANLVNGQALFIENCAACHGATGAGGAVGNQALAPSLSVASDVEIAEAMITGPGQMPPFDFTDGQVNDLVTFIAYMRDEPRPGGADIGGIGPVPEGFVAWFVGLGSLLVISRFIGSNRKEDAEDAA